MRAVAHAVPSVWSRHPVSAEEAAMVLLGAGRLQDAVSILLRVPDRHIGIVHKVGAVHTTDGGCSRGMGQAWGSRNKMGGGL